jgi:hypothetical protein
MFFSVLVQLLTLLIDLMTTTWQSDGETDLEIMLLRRQLAILKRVQSRPPSLSRWEKIGFAILVANLHRRSLEVRTRLRESLPLFKPETILGWHRALVRHECLDHLLILNERQLQRMLTNYVAFIMSGDPIRAGDTRESVGQTRRYFRDCCRRV